MHTHKHAYLHTYIIQTYIHTCVHTQLCMYTDVRPLWRAAGEGMKSLLRRAHKSWRVRRRGCVTAKGIRGCRGGEESGVCQTDQFFLELRGDFLVFSRVIEF